MDIGENRRTAVWERRMSLLRHIKVLSRIWRLRVKNCTKECRTANTLTVKPVQAIDWSSIVTVDELRLHSVKTHVRRNPYLSMSDRQCWQRLTAVAAWVAGVCRTPPTMETASIAQFLLVARFVDKESDLAVTGWSVVLTAMWSRLVADWWFCYDRPATHAQATLLRKPLTDKTAGDKILHVTWFS